MSKMVVVYTSKTGFTKKYAGWIAEALNCSAMDMKEWKKQEPTDFQTVIYGGGFYAGKIKGLDKMKEQLKNNPKIKLVVFATGATPALATEIVQQAMDGNFTEEERKNIPAYYFQSGLNYEKMSLQYKMMMKMFNSMLSKKEEKSEMETQMAAVIGHSFDACRKENIKTLLENLQ